MLEKNFNIYVLRRPSLEVSRHKGKYNDSGGESYTKSVSIFHKCGKKGHIKKDFEFNRNVSDVYLYERSTRKLPKGVTKK